MIKTPKRKNPKKPKNPKNNNNNSPKNRKKFTCKNTAINTSDPAYISVLKSMLAAAYRMVGLRRTFMHHYQAAALFDVDLNDLVNKDYEPQGVDEVNNLRWARKFNQRPCVVMAWQRHGACYAMLDNTLSDFKSLNSHIFKCSDQSQSLHFCASLFNRLPKDSTWQIRNDKKSNTNNFTKMEKRKGGGNREVRI